MQPQYPAKFRENQPQAFFAQWKRASVMRMDGRLEASDNLYD